MPQSSVPSTLPVASTVPDIADALEDELIGDELDNLLDCAPNEQETNQVKICVCAVFVPTEH